jgi:hypothetical protein
MSSNELVGAHGLKPQDFDSIRDAVMETPRGRWFLTEYANRLRSSETVGLLDSMRRLENAVTSNHDTLMSRLAEALSRESAPPPSAAAQPDLAPRHMKFFKQDEEIFEPAPQARIAAVPDLPKPEPKPAESKPEVPKGARVVIRRASETIEASLPAEAPQVVEATPVSEPLPSPVPVAQADAGHDMAPEAEGQPKRRIVIIRHKPGEQIDVPLQNEMAAAG